MFLKNLLKSLFESEILDVGTTNIGGQTVLLSKVMAQILASHEQHFLIYEPPENIFYEDFWEGKM